MRVQQSQEHFLGKNMRAKFLTKKYYLSKCHKRWKPLYPIKTSKSSVNEKKMSTEQSNFPNKTKQSTAALQNLTER